MYAHTLRKLTISVHFARTWRNVQRGAEKEYRDTGSLVDPGEPPSGDIVMRRLLSVVPVTGLLALAGCVVAPPTGPSVMALPPQNKNFAQFQQEDTACRQYASQQIGNASPADAATQSGITSAAVGTALGAAAGAVLGAAAGDPAAGAAIGAGSGLFVGGASGASAAQYSGGTLQQRYDMGYIQCMYSSGNTVPAVSAGTASYPYYPYGAYGYPYPYYPGYYAPYPAYFGPAFGGAVVFGFGGGGGHHHHGGGHHH